MPADFFIDATRGIVFSKASGVFGRTEAVDHMERLRVHPEFRPVFNQLWDFRDVTKVALSHDEIRSLARETVFSPHSRRAIVVSSDLSFGIGRTFGAYRDMDGESGILIFREMREALEWLFLEKEPEAKEFERLGDGT